MVKEFDENKFVEFLLDSFKKWAMQYDNKNKEDEFETYYYYIYQSILKSEKIRSMKKIDYFNKLKDIRNLVF